MRFRDEYAFLSNFYPTKIQVPTGSGTWFFPTAENAYQACKSSRTEDWFALTMMGPAEAKKHGRKLTLRPDWNEIKLQVMKEIVTLKFQQNTELMDKLIATGDIELTEENTWGDTYWGVCNGIGENHLGQILMEIRFLNNVYGKVEENLE